LPISVGRAHGTLAIRWHSGIMWHLVCSVRTAGAPGDGGPVPSGGGWPVGTLRSSAPPLAAGCTAQRAWWQLSEVSGACSNRCQARIADQWPNQMCKGSRAAQQRNEALQNSTGTVASHHHCRNCRNTCCPRPSVPQVRPVVASQLVPSAAHPVPLLRGGCLGLSRPWGAPSRPCLRQHGRRWNRGCTPTPPMCKTCGGTVS
jgi:hypothetical protein